MSRCQSIASSQSPSDVPAGTGVADTSSTPHGTEASETGPSAVVPSATGFVTKIYELVTLDVQSTQLNANDVWLIRNLQYSGLPLTNVTCTSVPYLMREDIKLLSYELDVYLYTKTRDFLTFTLPHPANAPYADEMVQDMHRCPTFSVRGFPGCGKSTFLYGWAVAQIQSGRSVLFVHFKNQKQVCGLESDGVSVRSFCFTASHEAIGEELRKMQTGKNIVIVDGLQVVGREFPLVDFMYRNVFDFSEQMLVTCTSMQTQLGSKEITVYLDSYDFLVVSWIIAEYKLAFQAGLFNSCRSLKECGGKRDALMKTKISDVNADAIASRIDSVLTPVCRNVVDDSEVKAYDTSVIFQSSGEEIQNPEQKLEKLDEAYYFGGGNFQFVHYYLVNTRTNIIDRQVARLSCTGDDLASQQSREALNQLCQQVDKTGGSFIVSKYVYRELAKKAGSILVSFTKMIKSNNLTWLCWIFESKFLSHAKKCQGGKLFLRKAVHHWLPLVKGLSIHEWEPHYDPEVNPTLRSQCFYEPFKWNQGCYDALYYLQTGRVHHYYFFQVSRAQKHNLKLSHVVTVLGNSTCGRERHFATLARKSRSQASPIEGGVGKDELPYDAPTASICRVHIYMVVPKERKDIFKLTLCKFDDEAGVKLFDPTFNSKLSVKVVYCDEVAEV